MSDQITVLRSLSGKLAKTWRKDGSIEAYGSAYHYAVEEHGVDSVEAMSKLLLGLAKEPSRCVIRGRWKADAPAPNTKAKTRRLNVCFDDAPRRWLALDVDQFQPLTADPVLEPGDAAREFVETMLPVEFHGAAFHLQLSNSAGAPGKTDVLKAHLWFWLSEAFTGAQLTAWQKRTASAFDPAFFRQVQINYTADPVFDGVDDPVPVREMFVPGRPEVALDIEAGDLVAEVRPSRFDGTGSEGDAVSAWLEDNWTTLGGDAKGHVFIECPFLDEHASGQGADSSTTYMPAGNGYEQGHFKCLHGHCEHRTDADFLEAMGFQPVLPEEFSVVPAPEGREGRVLPAFLRDSKNRIEVTNTNLATALARPDLLDFDVRADDFQGQMVYASGDGWAPFEDADYFEVGRSLEAIGFKTPGRNAVRDAVKHRASRNRIDTAMIWESTLVWDGVPRVETFLIDFFDVADTPYHRAVGLYAWTAMAGRLLSPGCQADMVPILVGGQGARKSSAIEAMVPLDHHRLMNFNQSAVERSRLMRGALVVELAELHGLKTRAIEEIKAWVTERNERWTPKYEEFAVAMGRRCILWGTTNEDELFDDPTGERRWLPVSVGTAIDVEGIKAAREQLWAEACALWRSGGVRWRDAETLAKQEHGAYRVYDTWEETLKVWASTTLLDGTSPGAEGFSVRDALVDGLAFPDRSIKRADEMRAAKALKSAGFVRTRLRKDGKLSRLWTNLDHCSNLA